VAHSEFEVAVLALIANAEPPATRSANKLDQSTVVDLAERCGSRGRDE
jgi:hypothetical protein